MSLVGIKDMSLIEEPPEERYPVQTYVMEQEDLVIRDAIEKELDRGGQVYVVYNKVKGINQIAAKIEALVPDARVAVGHGQMNEHKLEEVIMDFVDGGSNVLVATTIIETGVDIPNVNTMIILDADRFGLSQLYQLRGRVGRGRDKSWCILVSDNDGETARKRLDILCKTNNGYEIAEKDLELRGPGDFFAANPDGVSWDVRQSGGLRFAIASFCDDMEFLQSAFRTADAITAADPLMENEEHRLLREAMEHRFGTVIL